MTESKVNDQTVFHLFFLALAIGLLAPLLRGTRGVVLGTSAGVAIALMVYFYSMSMPDRPMARYLGSCEAAILVFVLLARWRKMFFWLAWALHALLLIVCVGIIVLVRYFFHPTF